MACKGSGFKSPQLHQAQRIDRTPAQGRLPEIRQSLTARVGQDTVSADRLGNLGVHGASITVRTSLQVFKASLRAGNTTKPTPTGITLHARWYDGD